MPVGDPVRQKVFDESYTCLGPRHLDLDNQLLEFICIHCFTGAIRAMKRTGRITQSMPSIRLIAIRRTIQPAF